MALYIQKSEVLSKQRARGLAISKLEQNFYIAPFPFLTLQFIINRLKINLNNSQIYVSFEL